MRLRTVLSLVVVAVLVTVVLAQGPHGPPGPRGRRPFGMGRQSPFENPTRAKDKAEEKILKTLDEIQKTQGRIMNVPESDGRLLRLLAESIEAKSVVEIKSFLIFIILYWT